ncbi:MAG: hypothetical protein WAO61_05195 [Solirubrobacterales bacterium]
MPEAASGGTRPAEGPLRLCDEHVETRGDPREGRDPDQMLTGLSDRNVEARDRAVEKIREHRVGRRQQQRKYDEDRHCKNEPAQVRPRAVDAGIAALSQQLGDRRRGAGAHGRHLAEP